MFLFILESIGTSELILIGIIALIFLGPRKLPQIAKKIGKTMADFRSTTNEFKATWQREVDFEEELSALRTGDLTDEEPVPTIPHVDPSQEAPNTIAAPRIDAADPGRFDIDPKEETIPQPEESTTTEDELSDKRNWL